MKKENEREKMVNLIDRKSSDAIVSNKCASLRQYKFFT